MTHRPILLLAFLATALCTALSTAQPMNAVLIVADDFGWADIGANNPNCFYETPNLDRLAASGVNFTRGYAAAPVCSPTRVSIMSGVNPALDAATEWFGEGPSRSERFLSADRINHLPTARPTIAEYHRAAGYETFFAGKWHLGGHERYLPQNRGFDINIAGCDKGNPGWKGGYFAPYADFIGLDAPEGEHLPARLTDETIDWIRSRDGEQPFLAVLSYYSVHTPLQGREDLVEKYRKRAAAMGLDQDDRYTDEEQIWPGNTARKVRIRQDNAVYAAMVEAMDEHIGRLLDSIDDAGLRENTIVVFVSDNGGLSTSEGSPTSNVPLRGGKGWLYEGGIRVPFMMRWPGVTEAGTTVGTAVHTSDIVPTILDATGAGAHLRDGRFPPSRLEGVSLRRVVSGEPLDRALAFHYPHYGNQGGFPGGVLMRGDMKYILRYEDGQEQLFDLGADLGEQNNLTATRSETIDSMRRELLGWLDRHHARFLTAKPGGPNPWQPSVD